MSKKTIGSKGVKTFKAFILSLIVYLILIAIIGLLVRFTPMPERWMHFYVLASLYLACFFLGILGGRVMKKRGLLFGGLFAIVFSLIVIMIAVIITGTFSQAGIMQIQYLPCVITGGIGGMLGVNIKE